MVMLQIMSIVIAFIAILVLVVEKARRRFFQLKDSIKFVREKNNKLQKDVEDIFGIYEGVRNVTATLHIEEILDLMTQMLHKFFDFSKADLYLLSVEKNNFFITMQYDFISKITVKEKIEMNDERIKEVVSQKRAVLYPTENEINIFGDDEEVKTTYMIVPLIVEEKVIGVIKMEREGEPFLPFGPDDLHKLSILCAQTSVILRRARLYAEVEMLAIIDGLTGLYVHRHFQEKLVQELRRAEAYGEVFSLVMADIDYFKKYNDGYGHLAGDELLRRVAKTIKEGLRETDIAARYGGEEFAAILIHQGKDEAMQAAENIRKKVQAIKLEIGGTDTGVTISIGISTFPRDGESATEIIKHADEALYKAKEGGRNRAVAYIK